MNAEEKTKKQAPLKAFKEFLDVNDDDVVVTIEHWYYLFLSLTHYYLVRTALNIRVILAMSKRSTISMQRLLNKQFCYDIQW